MTLDIAILDLNGSPKNQVCIGVGDHHRLMQRAAERTGSLLSRLKDYYADAEFGSDELGMFIQEATALRNRCRDDERLVTLLNDLIELAQLAERERGSLVAIAD